MLEEYLRLDTLELIYAFVLTLFIFLTGYFYNSNREHLREIKRLNIVLAETELDRASLQANSAVVPEDSEREDSAPEVKPGSGNTLLQQELENYLLKEDDKAQAAEQNFVELSADFVDFLKMKSGKIKLNEIPFTLNDMLGDLAKSLRSQTARTKVELIFDIDPKLPPKLIGDKRHIRLMLFNVLSNVIHHQSETQVVLHAESTKVDRGLKVQFRVEGCNINSSSGGPDALFVPFADGDYDESTQIEFYIARELSRMMHGDITLDIDDAGRNEFRIEIVLTESDPDNKRLYRLPSRDMTGHKILVVNENKMLAKSIQSMYEYFKNDVTLLRSSEFATNPEIIRDFHTVVIDKNALGLSVVEKVRAVKRAEKVNVVALLHAKDAVGYQLPTGAVDHLLIKPITIENVFNSIIALEEKSAGMTAEMSEESGAPMAKAEAKNLFEEFYGRRVLVIESDRANQQVLFSLLRRSGVNLTLAQNAQESMWMFSKMPVFDIILLSDGIDRKDTQRFSQKIRNLNRYKGVPIIVMSKEGEADESSAADQVTSNPIQPSTLLTLFNYYLSKGDLLGNKQQYFPSRAFFNTVSLAARDGFEMASFDEELYVDILREFATLYSESSIQMNGMLVKDDLQALRQLCLDVKGVAANIGAFRLSSITAKIHATISKGKAKDLMALMNQYQPELERVKKEIQSYLR